MQLCSIIKLSGILLVVVISLSFNELPKTTASLSDSSTKETTPFISQISRKVTVRFTSQYIFGSGVIVGHQNQRYSVLTCAHVLDSTNISEFRILTSDGQLHSIQRDPTPKFNNLDLALVTFHSDQLYTIVKPAQVKDVAVGTAVYASGFPNYRYRNQNWQDTFTLGFQAFYLTRGQVVLFLKQSMEEGYQMGLSNDIERGMSGGPVLNTQGELIAIAGRTKYAPIGIDAYQFDNGGRPSESLLAQMEAASWAIPISQFLQVFRN